MDNAHAASQLPGLSPALVERTRVLINAVAERDRIIARAEGEKATFLAELASIAHREGERSPAPNAIEDARRAMAAEVATATRTHPTAAKHQLSDAELLVDDYPTTHEALIEGRISSRHARAVADAGGALDPGARAALDHAAVPFAERCTPGDLKRIVKKQAAELAPLSLRERHQRERERRFVSVVEREDGMSDLLLYLPTFQAHGIYDRATQLARLVKADRRREREQFRRVYGHAVGEECPDGCRCESEPDRAGHDRDRPDDASQDGDRPGAPRGGAQDPGPDGGALHRDADDSAASGQDRPSMVAATDRRTMDQLRADLLIGRDVTCRFPGCTTLARKADIDHTHAYAEGGETTLSNLAALCESHHMMKHGSGWTPRQRPGGIIEWTSPAGHTYRDEPASRVFFRPTDQRDPRAGAPPGDP